MRCFIALKLPDAFKERLAEVPRRLDGLFPGARWVRPESFHVTLAFLGEIDGPALECAKLAVRAAAGAGPFDFDFSGLLCLPERGNPRVLALKAEKGDRECARIHGIVNRALFQAARDRGLESLNPEWPDGRALRVHVTLARAGGRPFPRNVAEAWERIRTDARAPCRVSQCILYRSDLRPDGARYMPVQTEEL